MVPVYNVEKYLRECLDSILAQSLKDIEVIVIDDGSPDNCGKIIDEYAKRDPRIIPIHQPNRGYSASVNYGIATASGEYIGIIESDDWIEPDMYEKLYQNATLHHTDVTKGGFWKYNSTLPPSQQNTYYVNPSNVDLRLAPSGPFTITEWPTLIAFHASIWSSIYKTSFIKKIQFADTTGASYQDFPFMVEALCRAERITVVPQGFVHWRNDPDQNNSTSASGKKLLYMADNSMTGVKIADRLNLLDQLKEPLYAHILWANFTFFLNIDPKYQKTYYEKLKKIFTPLKKDSSFKYTYFTPYDMRSIKIFFTKNWLVAKTIMLTRNFKHSTLHFLSRTKQKSKQIFHNMVK